MTKKISSANLSASGSLVATAKKVKGLAPNTSKVTNIYWIAPDFLKISFEYKVPYTDEGPYPAGSTVSLDGFGGSSSGPDYNFNHSNYLVTESQGNTLTIKNVGDPIDPSNVPGVPIDYGYIRSKFILRANFQLNISRTTTVFIDFETLEIPWTPNATFEFIIEEGFVKDIDRPDLSSILVNANFTTNPPPNIVGTIPESGEGSATGGTLQLTYPRVISKNTGYIHLYEFTPVDNQWAPGTLVTSFDISSLDITLNYSQTTITIPLFGYYNVDTYYYCLIDQGIVKDLDDFESPAVTDGSTLFFKTSSETAPIDATPLQDLLWTNNRFNIYLGELGSNNYLPRATSRNSVSYSKGIQLIRSSDNNLIKTFYHAKTAEVGADGTSSTNLEAAITSQSIYFFPRTFLENNTAYQIKIEDGSYYELQSGLNVLEETFTFNTNVEIQNSTTLSYIGNQDNKLFPNLYSYAKLLDTSSNHTITITSALGKFLASGIPLTSTFSYTGTRAQINALIPTIYFRPDAGVTSNGSCTITFTHATSGLLGTQTITLNYSGTTV